MKTITHFSPALYCAVLSLIAVYANTVSSSPIPRIIFTLGMPICFLFMGTVTARQQAAIQELMRQVDELRSRNL
ncbi:hypothetical protein [Planctomicrobium piriforme]|uniref:hypothetical protein n=1 Tax=Planctomicrobium piriforme TaxID=1576369 RepID=UPI000B8481B9|nr:hypothetical protein [Planctomicrobium piriforme]